MAHSLGPWVADDNRSPARVIAAGDPSNAIALVYLTDPTTRRRSLEYATNLSTIVAAPDMLAALKGLREWAQMMGGWDAPCWADADDAIAKAEGTDNG
jgi:hypothetical protein